MKIENIAASCVNKKIPTLAKKYGKHKVPRYIYHLTGKSNYESMLADGIIKTNKDILFGEGVFAVELTNLFKRWGKMSIWGGRPLQKRLIMRAARNNDDIVILKIPTEKLNHDLLKVRSQNALFKWTTSDDGLALLNKLNKKIIQCSKTEKEEFITNLRKQLANENPKVMSHLLGGAPAKNSNLFKQNKTALEYIYRQEIPIAITEKIGEVNIKQLELSERFNPAKPMRSIFTALLKDRPEVKGAEMLKY